MSIDDHAEELASDLGVDKEEVREKLDNLVSYNVPVEEAKQSLRRQYGVADADDDGAPTAKDLAELTPDDSNVTVTGTVLTVGKRSIRYQGEDQVIYEGEIADETGVVSYTSWTEFDRQPGETVRIGNAGVREWDGEAELNIGESTTVEPIDASLDVDRRIGGDASLSEIEPGDRGVNLEIRVLEGERKVIDGRDGETEILSGVLADETARLPFTDWDPHPEIEAGASLRLENTYVREFRGVPSVNVSEFSTVERLADPVAAREEPERLSIREAVGRGGAFDVELVGNVLAVRDGSGLIERCPECGRVIQKGQCRTHGEVDGVDDLRVKAILDDGTDTVTAVLDDELTADVYGGGIEDAKDHARDEMDQTVVADTIRERIVGREYRVRGSLSVDEYGANLDATAFAESDDDPAARADALLAEVGR
ncbi:replication factor A [Halobacteriales archaeon QS_1_68_17]|nr:MAG: replication factor A [Halobacteriales archaeon QS_1_68_17]